MPLIYLVLWDYSKNQALVLILHWFMRNLWYFYVAEILQNDEVIVANNVGEYIFDNIHSYSWQHSRRMAKLHADAATIV